jgi:hypothetical protein
MASSALAARLPRDVALAADEQLGDETTGITIARGHALLIAPAYAIRGEADVIEVRPDANEVLFKGRAVLSVGRQNYQSETLACTLDFSRCAPGVVPDSQRSPQPEPQNVLASPGATPVTVPR